MNEETRSQTETEPVEAAAAPAAREPVQEGSSADRLLTCLSAGVLSGIVAAMALVATSGEQLRTQEDAPSIVTVIPTVYATEVDPARAPSDDFEHP